MDMAREKGWLDEVPVTENATGGGGIPPARPAGWLDGGKILPAGPSKGSPPTGPAKVGSPVPPTGPVGPRSQIAPTGPVGPGRRGAPIMPTGQVPPEGTERTKARNFGLVKSSTAAKRKEWGDKIARAAGFEDNDHRFLFSASTLVADSGRKNFLARRKQHAEMPWFSEVAEQLDEKISGENRQDEKTRIEQLDFNSDGSVWWPGSPMNGRIEQEAIPDITALLGMPSAGEYLRGCTPKVRNYNLEEWKNFNIVEGMGGKIVNLRHRNNGSIFAVTGPEYQEIDTHRVARTVRDLVPSNAKGEVTYDGRSARLRAVWMDVDLPQDDLAVGDYLNVGIEIKTNDVGKGSVKVRAFVIQVKCINLNVTTGWIDVLNMKHDQRSYAGIGDVEQRIMQGVDRAIGSIKPFMEKWRESSIRSVLAEELHGIDIEPVFAKLVERRIIEKVVGVKDQEMVRRLKTAYWHDPSPTLRGVSNAITRMAHNNSWTSPWIEDDLHSVASEIIGGRYQSIMQKATAEAFDGGWRPGNFSLTEAQQGVVAQQPVFLFE